MGKNTLFVGIVVTAIVIGVFWYLSRRPAPAKVPAAPPQVRSTSGTGGLRAGVSGTASAACAIYATSQGAGALAPGCALVGPIAGDLFSHVFG